MAQAKMKQPQISAHVSEETKFKLDKLSRARGLRKAFMMEQALHYYFRALEELPEEALLPPRIVVGPEGIDKVLDMIENPSEPTNAMLELMNGDSD